MNISEKLEKDKITVECHVCKTKWKALELPTRCPVCRNANTVRCVFPR